MTMDVPFLEKALLNPELYPDHPTEVGFAETHISLVFFTGNYVYKVKKPVDLGFLNFTSLEKRKLFCEQEVVLNRRLAPKLYLGVSRITNEKGILSLDGMGEVIEYAVKMRQIPEKLLMDKLLEENKVTPEMIEAVSEKLTQFYAIAETNDFIKSFAKPERIQQDTDENFEETEKYVGITISNQTYEEIKGKTNEFLRTKGGLFYRRIASDRIRDCHGDLRMEHIFWGAEIEIFDCIEFNQRFRYTDVAADIAFLAMDIDFLGHEDLIHSLVQAYIEKSGDREILEVLDFYMCYRAYVRGKVESIRLDDPYIPELNKTEAARRAKRYFGLSHRYAERL